ncbi:triple QxxK/R motif-containing protein isoform X1 [Stegostoma tigrinum]|uniref:triple QxxK/R motif-containing protein isoform X1 n=1 Tax=Stegostoma tigrinum TaxID=3053191 RepID=UPI0028705F4C|nr:triple QxxK/R motif-containing protein isoform X1 [Stegostoma tigrinum]XP_059502110.1 triple QxxK/R motif-containing protein isoform X1 [Stegostoma tigrinum]XP_059502111.1 triple QxxK/R motif-containing protein isoform X1 [Stegostoma tigrinum]XP_059502112.1 triple QxxK/R motif-containing protein isoform X1 [Stegostoma tigrinum]
MARKDAGASKIPIDHYRKQIGKQDYKKTKSVLRATRLKAEAKKTAPGIRANYGQNYIDNTSNGQCDQNGSKPDGNNDMSHQISLKLFLFGEGILSSLLKISLWNAIKATSIWIASMIDDILVVQSFFL